MKASYHFWAPWIGPKTRADDLVFNSEYRKCHMIQENDEDELLNHPNYSEEDLLDMMNFSQVGTCRFGLKLQLISPEQTIGNIVVETCVILDVSSNVSLFAHPWKHCCGNKICFPRSKNVS